MSSSTSLLDDEIVGKCGLRNLSYEDLSIITKNFNKQHLRGTGYRWKVYRGRIVEKRDGCEEDDQEPEFLEVTVKIWDDPVDEDYSYFQDELRLLTNPTMRAKSMMAELFGYCREEDKTLALVYKFASMRTLEDKLCSPKFTWRMRVKAAIKIARGLAFLHKQDPPFIIRNLEPRHIMLDRNFNPKLFDFGLGSGWIFGDRTDAFPHVFCSDDYNKFHLQHPGGWSTKCDVFDFGIILLALVAKKYVPSDKTIHDVYLKRLKTKKPFCDLALLGGGASLVDLVAAAHVASNCVELSPEKRPSIIEVVTYLKRLPFVMQSAWLERGMRHPARMYLDFPDFKQPRSLSSKDLILLTDNFSESNFIDHVNALGVSNEGKVYRGSCKKGLNFDGAQEVTVRIWEAGRFSSEYFEDEFRFLTLPSMSSHPNLVKVIGCCHEKQMLGLVYDLASSCTLSTKLCDVTFSWAHRMKIALGIARALEFLHGQDPPFIHRNLDPAHILLDKDFNPKIYEFGWGSGGIFGDRVTFDPPYYGALGLMDPAYHGRTWNRSSDVFIFGLLLLALISCRKVSSRDDSEVCARSWINSWISGEKYEPFNIVHKGLKWTTGYHQENADEVLHLALLCVKVDAQLRPSMKEVVSILDRLAITPSMSKVELASVFEGLSIPQTMLEVTVKIWDEPVDEDFSYFQDELRTKSMMAELFGYCCEEDNTLALVYKLASMRTLEGKLRDAKFTWGKRMKVAIKIARGLEFLHSQDPPFIIRNLEPRHIMLDKNFNPKLFDFELGSSWIFGDRTDAFPHVFCSDDYNKGICQEHVTPASSP